MSLASSIFEMHTCISVRSDGLANPIPRLPFGSIGVDAVQQYGFGQGDQSNESAVEQAKDEQISDAIRRQFKSTTGRDVPIEDKETRFG